MGVKMDEKIVEIKKEFNNILMSDLPSDGLKSLVENGKMNLLIPEVENMIGFDQYTPFHDYDVFDHTLKVVDNVSARLHMRLAAFFHDIAKPYCLTIDAEGIGHFRGHHILSADMTRKIMTRLNYEDEIIEKVVLLVRYHYIKDIRSRKISLEEYIYSVKIENIDDMLELCRADVKGKSANAKINVVDDLELQIREYLYNKNYD